MKKSLLAILVTLCSLVGFAQTDLIVKSNEKGSYLTHTVSAKENFYSIGRLYSVSPKDISSFNNLDMNHGLSVGQSIMIPLKPSNFSQTSNTGTPVYYVVGEKEGLYRVSLKNNNVLMANLRKWNNLTSDNLSTGQKLIVGYVTSNELAASAPVVSTKSEPTIVEEKPKPQVQSEQPERASKTDSEPVTPIATSNTTTNTRPQPAVVKDGNGGYFKSQFEQQSKANGTNKDLTATAGIFKTASGWQDAKYYALVDGVEPGTIVRVINPNNSKAIYAKVLGAMSGISQNKGLDIRISNAAANVLEISDTEKFVVRVNY